MSDTAAQKDLILKHLQSGKTITPLEALIEYGCLRLGARIWELKKEGHDIKTEIVEVGGDQKRVAQYSLIPPKPVIPIDSGQPMHQPSLF